MATNPSTAPDGARNSQRRQEVIDAAAAAFARHGYHGASTRAIADELGIKVASLYFHIASKEEALGEICLTGTRRTSQYLRKAMEESDDLADTIRHFFRNQVNDFTANADYVSVFVREARHLSSAALAKISEVNREFIRQIDALFERARARGELAEGVEPRQARFVLIGAMRNFGQLYGEGRVADSNDIVATWVEVIIRGLFRNYVAPAACLFQQSVEAAKAE